MNPMTHLFVATAAFLLTHFVPSTPLRAALVAKIGERAYLGLYVLVAFATLGWMIFAYNRAPLEPLWPGVRLLPALVMPFAFLLLAGGIFTRNPTAVGQQKALQQEEPARGMLRITRHPIQWGILLWAAAHVLARGEFKSTVFFGSFVLLAALGTVLMDRRKASLGQEWERFARATSNVPFLAIAQGRNRFVASEIRIVALLHGIAFYVAFLLLHGWLFGARPY